MVAYVPLALGTALSGAFDRQLLHAVTKSALVPTLQIGAWVRGNRDPVLLGASSAGWLGDVILLPRTGASSPEAQRRQLRWGAVAFGVQQIGYIGLLARAGVRPQWRRLAVVAPWLGGLSALDMLGGEGSAPDPIITTYGVLLGGMTTMAWSTRSTAMQCGGVLFLASDSMILIREVLVKGRVPRALAEVFVLSTYAAAQALLIGELATQRP